jgi:hypothetical protein
MANTVRDLFEQNGIPALAHSYQIPAYDGLARMMRPVWGEVLVEEADWDRAKELLDGFLAEQEEPRVEERGLGTRSESDGPDSVMSRDQEEPPQQ